MPDYLARPVTQVRRLDRALVEAEWVEQLLALAPVGYLATVWEGQPMLHSNYFWYDTGRVYWHTAGVGRLRAMFDADDGRGAARGCFTVAEFGRILPAGTPLDFSTEYASVVLYGPVRVVTDATEKRHALDGLMAKYAPHLIPGTDYAIMPDADIARTSVYALDVEQHVGKHNVKPHDYPAYPYPGGSFIMEERDAGRVVVRPKELDEA